MKRLTRNDNKRFHTTGVVDDIKVSEHEKYCFTIIYPPKGYRDEKCRSNFTDVNSSLLKK